MWTRYRSNFKAWLLLISILSLAGIVTFASMTVKAGEANPLFARFTADGQLERPAGYRGWIHVGTRVKPIGINILDNKVTATPEILNTYVHPNAFNVFMHTGVWPAGTVIVKEFSAVRTGAGCDKAGLCSGRFGTGMFQSGYAGLGAMVKDPVRFPKAPGHWGYFSFGHQSPPYQPTALADSGVCAACHIRLASKTDYVIQAHLGLLPPDQKPPVPILGAAIEEKRK